MSTIRVACLVFVCALATSAAAYAAKEDPQLTISELWMEPVAGPAGGGIAPVATARAVPSPPTPAFAAEDALRASVYLYDHRQFATTPVLVSTSVVDARGVVVVETHERVEAFAFDPVQRGYHHRIVMPLNRLDAGRYTLRVQAGPSGDERGSALVRELPFIIRGQPPAQTN